MLPNQILVMSAGSTQTNASSFKFMVNKLVRSKMRAQFLNFFGLYAGINVTTLLNQTLVIIMLVMVQQMHLTSSFIGARWARCNKC
jgi:hypothetical protein